MDDEFQPVANDVIAVSSSEINYFVLFVKYVAEASVVQLGVSGSIGNYLPYYVYICDGTLEWRRKIKKEFTKKRGSNEEGI